MTHIATQKLLIQSVIYLKDTVQKMFFYKIRKIRINREFYR